MPKFSGWDLAILTVAAYVAIVTLVRLMRQCRDEAVARLQLQVTMEQRRRRLAEKQMRRQKAIEQQFKAQRGT